ncbi:MAG: hydroxymethylpyrimidine/phosphomethylpyrimidine kinase [Aureispira sp.]|nr:hydroxymethylpyrimidine/phosphomethylpyrimidine kinase [Aureispira sp.]
MQKNERPYALSIAGFDPSGGAGFLADAKTMEAHEVYALTVATAVTVQHESVFQAVEWVKVNLIKRQINLLFQRYPVGFCKIGLIENWNVLLEVTNLLLTLNPTIKIVVDPIFRASAGFDFHKNVDIKHLKKWLLNIYLLTPNAQELARINEKKSNLMEVANELSEYCNILYKGGHNETQKGTDFLFAGQKIQELAPKEIVPYEKHGSGCVLSAAIVANLALGQNLYTACEKAKAYITHFLNSNETLLGHHYP